MPDKVVTKCFNAIVFQRQFLFCSRFFGFQDKHWMFVFRERAVKKSGKSPDFVKDPFVSVSQYFYHLALSVVGSIYVYSSRFVRQFTHASFKYSSYPISP